MRKLRIQVTRCSPTWGASFRFYAAQIDHKNANFFRAPQSSQLFFRDYSGKTWYNEVTKGADSKPLQKPVKL
jgi:hypothetical protein